MFKFYPEQRLLQPIKCVVDGKEQLVKSWNFKPYSQAQFAALAEKMDDAQPDEGFPSELEFGLMALASGFTPLQIESMATPDMNDLQRLVFEYSNTRSADYISRGSYDASGDLKPLELEVSSDVLEQTLIKPLHEFGERINLVYPSVAANKKMVTVKNDSGVEKANETILCSVTQASYDQLKDLLVPDWLELNLRVRDFLSQGAADFRLPTFKT